MSVALLVMLTFMMQSCSSTSHQTGYGNLELASLESRIYGNSRQLRVWLPPGAAVAVRHGVRYPVLYLNDGQDLFDAETAVLGTDEWEVDETMSKLISAGAIPPIIVVGIDNAGKRLRPNEYLVYPDQYLKPPVPRPQGRHYAEFLATEVIPFVEQNFPVTPGRAHRALGGSSYGALIALHVAIDRPNLFSRLLLESPSLYVDDKRVLKDLASSNLEIERIYVGIGTNELGVEQCAQIAGNINAVNDVIELARLLNINGLRPDQIRVFVDDCAQHAQAAWARRLPKALQFLYGNGN